MLFFKPYQRNEKNFNANHKYMLVAFAQGRQLTNTTLTHFEACIKLTRKNGQKIEIWLSARCQKLQSQLAQLPVAPSQIPARDANCDPLAPGSGNAREKGRQSNPIGLTVLNGKLGTSQSHTQTTESPTSAPSITPPTPRYVDFVRIRTRHGSRQTSN